MLRWHSEQRESWSWDSRMDCWCKDIYITQPVLQYQDAQGEWHVVPSVLDVVQPAGPEPRP